MSTGTIEVKRNSALAYLAVAAVLITLLALTILNKSWWARRISAKWSEVRQRPSDMSSTGFEVEVVAPNLDNYNVIQLASLYFKGAEDWQRIDHA